MKKGYHYLIKKLMSNIINLIEEVTKNECDATWKLWAI